MTQVPDLARPDSVRSASGDAAVTLNDVSVFYGEVVGLSKVTLALTPGITGIVGPNGSGKTTLMRALTGLLAPLEGAVSVLGGNPFTDARIRDRISLVPAGDSFFQNLSARKNLEVAFLAKGKSRAQARELGNRALELSRLTADGDRRYGTLSRGTRQRVKLGLALAADSDLVLFDEPFLGVDPPNRKSLRETMIQMGSAGRTVVVSSHILHEVESLTDKVGVLAHGRLLGFGRIEALLRELRDRHPHRVNIHTSDPRKLGAALLTLSEIQEIKVTGDTTLEFITEGPDLTYKALPGLIVGTGIVVQKVETMDNTLEAVFKHVTAVGTRRL